MISRLNEEVYDRQKRITGWNQERISEQRVLVVGAGALGNEVVKLLLQAGVNNITLVDFDSVEAANLNRCIFFEASDVGKTKAEVIAEKAVLINPRATIAPILKKIEELPEEFYEGFGFAFSCLDSLGARLHLNAHCYAKAALIDAGINGLMGKVQVTKAPSSCIECSVSEEDYKGMWKKYSCKGEPLDFLDPKTPALSTTNNVIAGVQANEFVKLALGMPEKNTLVGRYLFYNGSTEEFRVYEVIKRRGCPVHL
ncbi:ThiF family adenylyltransferase [Candidatus Micrarchaeota archaeon]|nr:ThiF family adenylyltransferase [Candidatus Micrarchaeota archaeon]